MVCLGFLVLLLLTLTVVPGRSPVVKAPEPEGLRGRLLVATSHLDDPPFAGTVIYIVEHSADGAMGLVINRPMRKISFAELLRPNEKRGPEEGPKLLVYYGGPVERNRGFLLHSSDVMLERSRVIADGVAMTVDPTILDTIAEGKGPKKYLFALGYAGWRANQLEDEITQGFWLTVDADSATVFADDPAQTWKRLIDVNVFRL